MITKLTQEQVNAYCMGNQKIRIVDVQTLTSVLKGKDGYYYYVQGREDQMTFLKTIGMAR